MGDKFFAEVAAEREYQNQKWGDGFDAKNTPNDWMSYILRYAGKCVLFPFNAGLFKEHLVKVAALCQAAYEWCDRSEGNMPKRHYD